MDLLTDDSVSGDEDHQNNKKNAYGTNGTEHRGRAPDLEGRRGPKRRKRGTIEIVPSHRAPENIFQRSIPHKRGHWSGHILVPVTSVLSPEKVRKSLSRFQNLLERHGYSGFLVQHDDLHMSLSKPFSLQLAFLDSFVQQLRERLRWESPTCLFVSDDDLEESNRAGETILVNEERTRTFWGWRVQPNPTILRIVKEIDMVLAKYQQPSYYDPPIFHVSLASFAGNFDYDRVEAETCEDIREGNLSPSSSLQRNIENGLVKPCERSRNSEKDGDAGDGESSGDDGDDDEKVFSFISVETIICKFGTTKKYLIQLRSHH